MRPTIMETAGAGIPDQYRSEAVKAFVTFRPGAMVTVDEVLEFCRANLAKYKSSLADRIHVVIGEERRRQGATLRVP